MEQDAGQTELDEDVAVAEPLRNGLLKRMRSCNRVVIEYEVGDNKWKRVEAWKLTCKPGDYPTTDPDEIAQNVANAVHLHWEENCAEEEGAGNYRVWCHAMTPDGKRKRPSFTYVYSGPDSAESGIAEDELEERESELMTGFRLLERIVDKLALRLDESHLHIKEISNQNHALHQPMIQSMGYMGQMYVAGLQLQQNAMGAVFDLKRADKEDAAKDRRLEKYVKMFGPAAQALIVQFLNRGKGGAATASGAPGGANGGSYTPGSVKPPWAQVDFSAGGDEEEAEGDAEGDDVPGMVPDDGDDAEDPSGDNALAHIAITLGRTLGPGDWAKISGILTKKELSEFAALLSSATDDVCVAQWDKIGEGAIDLMKLVRLVGVLDVQQRAGY